MKCRECQKPLETVEEHSIATCFKCTQNELAAARRARGDTTLLSSAKGGSANYVPKRNERNETKPLSTWWRRVGVRRDRYAGWEIVFRYIWFPFWICLPLNTHFTREAAIAWARDGFREQRRGFEQGAEIL